MENHVTIEEKLEQMSQEGTLSKRQKTPVIGAVLLVVGIVICIFGTQPMQVPDWVKLLLITTGIVVFLYAMIRLLIDMHSGQFYHEPTHQPIKKRTIYIPTEYKSEIVNIVDGRSFKNLKNIKKTYSSGVVLTAMCTCDGNFSMLQVQEYLQNEFVPTTEAIVVDEDGKQLVMEFLRSPIA